MIVQTDPRRPCVVLVGPPGAGKSTIGRKLAKELGVELFDTDAGIEDETGRTIPEIFADDGEPEFRRIEERVVRRAILAERGVVSLGGGAVLSANTRQLLHGRTVVYLEISVAEGLRRTGASNNRPLLAGDDPSSKYRKLMHERRPLYREVASVRVRTDGRSPGRVVRNIMAKLDLEPVEPDPSTTPSRPADGEGTSRRARARRRRRARTATNKANSPSTQQETTADQNGEATPQANESTDGARESAPRRRSRRSRRGGRRHRKSTAADGTLPTTADCFPADAIVSSNGPLTGVGGPGGTPGPAAVDESGPTTQSAVASRRRRTAAVGESATTAAPTDAGRNGAAAADREQARAATSGLPDHPSSPAVTTESTAPAVANGDRRRRRRTTRASGAPGLPTAIVHSEPAHATPETPTTAESSASQDATPGTGRSRRSAVRAAGPPIVAAPSGSTSSSDRPQSSNSHPIGNGTNSPTSQGNSTATGDAAVPRSTRSNDAPVPYEHEKNRSSCHE
ncbi:shikimate kinase [Nocardia pseudobrasiliensis]|uniref:Shikimate kinase n=1 Tax=Nocardia pseudobrasiliensis TaxID=45979 RepID=A0A370I9N6_9NOCA|nr:shikimate kinase [Nocardia pseudobrasiliensis]